MSEKYTIGVLVPKLSAVAARSGDSPRWLAARLLEGDGLARELVGDAVSDPELAAIAGDLSDEIDILLADARYGLAHALTKDVIEQKSKVSHNLSDRIDRVMLNRALGIPIFLVAMYLMFMFTINIGGAFIDFFDMFAGTLFVDGFAEVLGALGSPEWLTVGLASGIGGGVQVVATFIPIIAAPFLIGIAAAVATGLIMKATLLKGDSTPFVMELPPYHLPTLKGVLSRTRDRTKSFMFRAGKVIVPMVLVLNVLNSVGTDGSIGNEDSDKSVLAEIGRTIAPAFSPMGLDEENWPAAVYRETTPGWTLFVAAWTTGLGYMVATIFYQAAIFTRHPGISLAWIGGMGAIFTFVVLMMRYRMRRDLAATPLAATEAV